MSVWRRQLLQLFAARRGGSTLVRLNLKAIAERSASVDDFFTRTLPHYCQQQIAIIDSRCEFLYEKSHFFENSFLVQEGLIDPERFVPMFGMYGFGGGGESTVR